MMLLLLLAALPADLAPGAPELSEGEARLRSLVVTSEAVGAATGRLRVAWTGLVPVGLTPGKEPCADAARLDVGWKIERFGAAWREAAQAARAQARRVRRIRNAPTVAPLVDARWAATLDGLFAAADRQERALLEASAWQVLYVRPLLGACPVPEPLTGAGIPMERVAVRGEPPAPVAVLGLGDGFVCGGDWKTAVRADDGIALVAGNVGCWAGTASCSCTPEPIYPGATLGPPTPAELPTETPAAE